jgi:hypothetical protein
MKDKDPRDLDAQIDEQLDELGVESFPASDPPQGPLHVGVIPIAAEQPAHDPDHEHDRQDDEEQKLDQPDRQ